LLLPWHALTGKLLDQPVGDSGDCIIVHVLYVPANGASRVIVGVLLGALHAERVSTFDDGRSNHNFTANRAQKRIHPADRLKKVTAGLFFQLFQSLLAAFFASI
jgi:hypothetical protein